MNKQKILSQSSRFIRSAANCGALLLLYKAYKTNIEFWLGFICLLIIASIDGYMMYKEKNKEYFEKKEAEKNKLTIS